MRTYITPLMLITLAAILFFTVIKPLADKADREREECVRTCYPQGSFGFDSRVQACLCNHEREYKKITP